MARNHKAADQAGRKQLMAQAAWAYQSAGLLLMAPDTFRSEAARERAREWLLDVLADTADGRTARAGLIAYAEATDRSPKAPRKPKPTPVPVPAPATPEPTVKQLKPAARKR